MRSVDDHTLRWRIKPALFLACLLPLAYYLWGVAADQLGANPIEALTRGLGDWALRLLLATLAISPLRWLSGWSWLVRLRRMIGLFAFFYASLHWLSYLWLDQFFDWAEIWGDVVKRPFITAGMLAFLLLVPLALTSTDAWVRRLKRNWARLHRLVYLAAPLVVLHFFWMKSSKADVTEPLLYAAILGGLLAARVFHAGLRRHRAKASLAATRL